MANLDNSGSPLAMASAKGTVKWFNSTKGYGFITLENGGDAFCHASALAALGTPQLDTGATVVCDLQDSPRGLQVVQVHSVDNSTAQAPAPRAPRRDGGGGRFDRGDRGDRGGDRGDRFSSGYRAPHYGGDRFGGGRDSYGGSRDSFGGGRESYGESSSGGAMVEGKVKFFNEQKGFGFIMPENGGTDVYVHASALRRCGVPLLAPEQRVRYSTRQGMKGVEVDRLEVI
jgi:CspA family cold shock protein